MPTVYLGNPAALDRGKPMDGQRVTTAVIPEDYTAAEALAVVTHADGVWANHSSAGAPLWVESSDEELANALSKHYGCPIGRPDQEEDAR